MKIVRLALFLTLLGSAAQASVVYNVSLDTSFLQLDPQPLNIGFELADGSATGDGNNVVQLSNFNFGVDGNVTGIPINVGSSSGDVFSTVTLTDSQVIN